MIDINISKVQNVNFGRLRISDDKETKRAILRYIDCMGRAQDFFSRVEKTDILTDNRDFKLFGKTFKSNINNEIYVRFFTKNEKHEEIASVILPTKQKGAKTKRLKHFMKQIIKASKK